MKTSGEVYGILTSWIISYALKRVHRDGREQLLVSRPFISPVRDPFKVSGEDTIASTQRNGYALNYVTASLMLLHLIFSEPWNAILPCVPTPSRPPLSSSTTSVLLSSALSPPVANLALTLDSGDEVWSAVTSFGLTITSAHILRGSSETIAVSSSCLNSLLLSFIPSSTVSSLRQDVSKPVI